MRGAVELRAAVSLDVVNYPKRQIELIVMPYETETLIAEDGKVFTEIVSRGAFTGVEKRTSTVRVNVDHRSDVASTIGRTLALHPSRQEGLVADVKISKTDLGDHALELAADGSLGASAGFTLLWNDEAGRVHDDAEVWESKTRRRLNKLWLDHIALTPTPAYPAAEVLAVRADLELPRARMPNLDLLELDRLRAQQADMFRRYTAR